MDKKAIVWGLGKSGLASACLLQHKGWQVRVYDHNQGGELTDRQQQLSKLGIEVYLGQDFTPADLVAWSPQIVIVSPGIAWDHPLLRAARAEGINTIGEVELGWQYLSHVPWVGITGTNGKSTTTALISAIFQTAGYYAPACGNIGLPICQVALTPPAWVIAELSSYQIEAAPSVCPQIGVWTTFTPDHLSRHGTIERYSQIKAQLLHQSRQQVLNGDDPYLQQQRQQFPQAVWVSTASGASPTDSNAADVCIAGERVYFRGQPVLSLRSWRLLGQHNLQNLLLAVGTARLAGIEAAAIEQAVANFRGMPHRLEVVANYQGVLWINDSKATNYDAAETGLKAVDAPVLLVAGGEAKAGNPQPWLRLIKDKVARVLLIGSAAELFSQLLTEQGFTQWEVVATLDRAVAVAAGLVPTLGIKTVLFSPACASFDQYPNFEVRGDHFRRLVQGLEHD
ncbi:MAG: UDP-N-acetylmuramoyl-L-alanine--D-glutamate ligase [Pseudanabaenaceae cyanobacterium SKYGB_i_bin29]|nr:UDP-N-acetylmuramoyl-L-alanine--D-glutamate ligase [Pseudanabaenaceae cyanobacterium SKYG29]MDW8420557.1 UDP-N-acetylmuramoyl-L-alanine--D-glutamate ligase [Pseudanabaenaceae cyanobacterium SKYGB_i_bin29]